MVEKKKIESILDTSINNVSMKCFTIAEMHEKLALITYNTKLKYNLMGFYRKYNTIIRSIDNLTKLYKLSKKKKSESKKEDKK